MAKRVSKQAFVKNVHKQICKVNSKKKLERGTQILMFPGKARSISAEKPNRLQLCHYLQCSFIKVFAKLFNLARKDLKKKKKKAIIVA